MASRCLPLALLAMLGACAEPRAIYFGEDFSALYRRIEVSAAGAQGPVPLMLRGNPFGGTPESIADAVIAGLAQSTAQYPIRFTVGDPGPRSVDYRVIIAFGQPSLGANGLCANPDAPFTAESQVNATAAFCIGDRMVSSARGRSLDPIAGPGDPAFAAFLKGLAHALFPPANPRRPECGAIFPC